MICLVGIGFSARRRDKNAFSAQFTAQVVPRTAWSLEPVVPGMGQRAGFNQLCLSRPAADRAGDGPGAATSPALVALAKLVAVASPGQIAKVGAIISNYVNVRAIA